MTEQEARELKPGDRVTRSILSDGRPAAVNERYGIVTDKQIWGLTILWRGCNRVGSVTWAEAGNIMRDFC